MFFADDSQADGMLLDIAFTSSNRIMEIHQVHDGAAAFEQLLAVQSTFPFPYQLIVMDLNLPKIGGVELLTRIRTWPALEAIPIIILTSSQNPRDRERVVEQGGRHFLIKPNDFPGMIELAGILAQLMTVTGRT